MITHSLMLQKLKPRSAICLMTLVFFFFCWSALWCQWNEWVGCIANVGVNVAVVQQAPVMFICFSTHICVCCIWISQSDYFGKTVLSTSTTMNHVSQVARSHLCCSVDIIGPVRMHYVFQYFPAPTLPSPCPFWDFTPHPTQLKL